jgi:hypothetical protein
MEEKETFNGLVQILRDPKNFARIHKRIVSSVITPETNLYSDLGFSRIGYLEAYELGNCIADYFNVDIPDLKIETFQIVKEYADYVEKHSPEKRQVS